MNWRISGVAAACMILLPIEGVSEEQGISAGDESNVVVVLSELRRKNLQQTPSSLAVLFDEHIQQRSAQHLDELLAAVANVNFNSGASRGRFVQIRGIGERSQFQDPINPSVAFYIDGIDFSGLLGGATLYDVAQLELLRGPQGARFGANALAGAIYLETESADSEKQRLDLTLAEQNTWGLGTALGGQINENLAMRLAVQQYQSDGFIDNIYLNRDNTQSKDELTGRLKANWQVSDDLLIKFAWHHFDINNGYDAFSLDNDRKTRSDQPGYDIQDTNAYSVQVEHIGLESVDFQLSVAQSSSFMGYGYDEDWTFDGFHPWGYSSFDSYLRDRDSSNLDARWLSKSPFTALGVKHNWVVGFYAKQEDERLTRKYTYLTTDFHSQFETDTSAVYGELQSSWSDYWRTTIGLRSEIREADYSDDGLALKTDDRMLGGRLSLEYLVNSGSMVYGQVARGFKAGGVNPQIELDSEKRVFGAEYNWNYELGYKARILDDDASLRLAAFYMERDNQQTKSWEIYLRPDNTTEFIGFVDNVDNGTNYGIELDFDWQINDVFRLTSSLGWLETQLKRIERQDGSVVFNREQAQAPNYSYHLALNITPVENWFSIVTFEGKGKEYFSDTHDEQSVPVNLVHWQLGYQTQQWRIAFWIKNLTDETYHTRGFGGFGNDPRNGYETAAYYQLADPRFSGVSVSYQF